MPTLRHYDDNGLLEPATTQNERLTSFDSFMQGLDEDYDQRKQIKTKTIQRKSSEVKKTTAPPPPPAPLTLDGPIEYRDKKEKKKKAPPPPPLIKKVIPKKRPVLSSSSEDEGGDPSKMVYDEDEAW
jgi:hypothetical protein